MKALIAEDNIFKYAAVKRAVAQCGDFVFVHAATLENAKVKIQEAHKADASFDLIVTDTDYPENNGGEISPDAGLLLIGYAGLLDPPIPVIICSAEKLQPGSMSNVLGTVRYIKYADMGQDFRALLQNL